MLRIGGGLTEGRSYTETVAEIVSLRLDTARLRLKTQSSPRAFSKEFQRQYPTPPAVRKVLCASATESYSTWKKAFLVLEKKSERLSSMLAEISIIESCII